MTFVHILVPMPAIEEADNITSVLPGKVFYSHGGEILVLADDGKYIVSINSNGGTSSAYLYCHPLANSDLSDPYPTDAEMDAELRGWTAGWEA